MMKKTLWMLAAILFCSLGTTMLTACGSDDDDDKGKDPGKGKADVRIAVVTQRDTYNMFNFDFTLTDHTGKTTAIKFDASDKSDDKFYEIEATYFQNACLTYLLLNPQLKEFFENVNMHHYLLKDVPSGSTIEYKTISNLIKSYEPKEKGNTYLMATVMVTMIVDGNERPIQAFNFNCGSPDKSIYLKYMERYDGKVVEQSSNKLSILY